MIILDLEVLKDWAESISHLPRRGHSKHGEQGIQKQRCEAHNMLEEITVLYNWSVALE